MQKHNIFGKHCKQLLGQIVVSAPRGYEIVGEIVGKIVGNVVDNMLRVLKFRDN